MMNKNIEFTLSDNKKKPYLMSIENVCYIHISSVSRKKLLQFQTGLYNLLTHNYNEIIINKYFESNHDLILHYYYNNTEINLYYIKSEYSWIDKHSIISKTNVTLKLKRNDIYDVLNKIDKILHNKDISNE